MIERCTSNLLALDAEVDHALFVGTVLSRVHVRASATEGMSELFDLASETMA